MRNNNTNRGGGVHRGGRGGQTGGRGGHSVPRGAHSGQRGGNPGKGGSFSKSEQKGAKQKQNAGNQPKNKNHDHNRRSEHSEGGQTGSHGGCQGSHGRGKPQGDNNTNAGAGGNRGRGRGTQRGSRGAHSSHRGGHSVPKSERGGEGMRNNSTNRGGCVHRGGRGGHTGNRGGHSVPRGAHSGQRGGQPDRAGNFSNSEQKRARPKQNVENQPGNDNHDNRSGQSEGRQRGNLGGCGREKPQINRGGSHQYYRHTSRSCAGFNNQAPAPNCVPPLLSMPPPLMGNFRRPPGPSHMFPHRCYDPPPGSNYVPPRMQHPHYMQPRNRLSAFNQAMFSVPPPERFHQIFVSGSGGNLREDFDTSSQEGGGNVGYGPPEQGGGKHGRELSRSGGRGRGRLGGRRGYGQRRCHKDGGNMFEDNFGEGESSGSCETLSVSEFDDDVGSRDNLASFACADDKKEISGQLAGIEGLKTLKTQNLFNRYKRYKKKLDAMKKEGKAAGIENLTPEYRKLMSYVVTIKKELEERKDVHKKDNTKEKGRQRSNKISKNDLSADKIDDSRKLPHKLIIGKDGQADDQDSSSDSDISLEIILPKKKHSHIGRANSIRHKVSARIKGHKIQFTRRGIQKKRGNSEEDISSGDEEEEEGDDDGENLSSGMDDIDDLMDQLDILSKEGGPTKKDISSGKKDKSGTSADTNNVGSKIGVEGGHSRKVSGTEEGLVHDSKKGTITSVKDSDDRQTRRPRGRQHTSERSSGGSCERTEEEEGPDETDVFRLLVKKMDGISTPDNLVSSLSAVPAEFNITKWLQAHRHRLVVVERDGFVCKVIAFYRSVSFCLDYNKLNRERKLCTKIRCEHFHICKDFVAGFCPYKRCRMSHDFFDRTNKQNTEKMGLDIFNNEEIRIILKCRNPTVCEAYQSQDCKDSACHKLHVCQKNMFGKCLKGKECELDHSFRTKHNLSIIAAYHMRKIFEENEFLFKRLISAKKPQRMQRDDDDDEEEFDAEEATTGSKGEEKVQRSSSASNLRRKGWHRSSQGCETGELIEVDTEEPLILLGSDPDVSEPKLHNVKDVLKPTQAWKQEQTGTTAVHLLDTEVPDEESRVEEPARQDDDAMPKRKDSVPKQKTKESYICREDDDNFPICERFLVKKCEMKECKFNHCPSMLLPHLWQVKMYGTWATFDKLESLNIEEDFCKGLDFSRRVMLYFSGISYTIRIEFMDHEFRAIIVEDENGVGSRDEVLTAQRLSTKSYVEMKSDPKKPKTKIENFYTQWRWYWKDDYSRWQLFSPDSFQYTLEKKFKTGQKSYLYSRENYRFKYRLDFRQMEQVNLDTRKVRSITRRPVFVSAGDVMAQNFPACLDVPSQTLAPKPPSWAPWDLNYPFELVELDTGSADYTDVESSFFKTLDTSKIQIDTIYRIQNPVLWNNFCTQEKNMKSASERAGVTSPVDKRDLFHGTDTLDTVCGISLNCFDFRVSGKNAVRYGEGAYFARDAKYSDAYTKAGNQGERFMFQAKVLVGCYTPGRSEYKRPPEKPGATHELYDSCVDREIDPTIFIIFDRNQCYPEFLVQYTRIMDNTSQNAGYVSSRSAVPARPLYVPNSHSNPTSAVSQPVKPVQSVGGGITYQAQPLSTQPAPTLGQRPHRHSASSPVGASDLYSSDFTAHSPSATSTTSRTFVSDMSTGRAAASRDTALDQEILKQMKEIRRAENEKKDGCLVM